MSEDNMAGPYDEIWDQSRALFNRKCQDYTNSDGKVFESSGLLGQYMKLQDKIKKLKKPMWDAEILLMAEEIVKPSGAIMESGLAKAQLNLQFEGAEEIIMDLMGHCVLALSILQFREVSEAKASIYYEQTSAAKDDHLRKAREKAEEQKNLELLREKLIGNG